MAEVASKAASEALIPQFQLSRVLNQDQAGRRVILYGAIADKAAIMILERSPFPSTSDALSPLPSGLTNVRNLGHNDIYAWYMASSPLSISAPDVKVNLIYPCTEAHVKKYSQQGVRMVTETPDIFTTKVRPYMQRKREEGRLNWVFNIIEGRTEQEDVCFRSEGNTAQVAEGNEGFLMLPDLNWDRKTLSSLHLLGLVERRDIWSLRDLKKHHVLWLKHMREKLLEATVELYPELEKNQLKLYMHYQPTYYHFHIHIVNVMLEAGATQATGKAFGLENLISQLETLQGGDGAGVADFDLTYTLGEESELWTEIFQPLQAHREN
ncbi:MAG: ubiquitin-protein ligase peroxin 12 [Chaenotheca gracillima]|nr:MAG: ubiquitin-protein ligase peroxin 12 [Chaenotheca gracillima]